MYVTFIGNPSDPGDNVGKVHFGGVDFPLNREIEVEETPLMRKLRGNRHFKVRDASEAEAADDGKDDADASEIPPKAELVAFAEANGITIDKRWSAAKIHDAIREYEAREEYC